MAGTLAGHDGIGSTRSQPALGTKTPFPSVQQQDRQFAAREQAARKATEDEFAHAAVAVGAGDDEIGLQLPCFFDEYVRAAMRFRDQSMGLYIHSMPGQLRGQAFR